MLARGGWGQGVRGIGSIWIALPRHQLLKEVLAKPSPRHKQSIEPSLATRGMIESGLISSARLTLTPKTHL